MNLNRIMIFLKKKLTNVNFTKKFNFFVLFTINFLSAYNTIADAKNWSLPLCKPNPLGNNSNSTLKRFSLFFFLICTYVCWGNNETIHHFPLYGIEPMGKKQGIITKKTDKFTFDTKGLKLGQGFFAPTLKVKDWDGDKGGVAFWVCPHTQNPELSKNAVILCKADASKKGEGFYIYRPQNSNSVFMRSIGSENKADGKSSVLQKTADSNFSGWKPGEWRHFAVTWERGKYIKFFVNGVEISPRSGDFRFPFPSQFDSISFGRGDNSKQGFGLGNPFLLRDVYFSTQPFLRSFIKTLVLQHPEQKSQNLKDFDIFPFALDNSNPQIDGTINPDEYSTCIPGLINSQNHVLYERSSELHMSIDKSNLYIAGKVKLPKGYKTVSAATKNNTKELADSGNLFGIMLRNDSNPRAQTFSGLYLMVAPSGRYYIANEKVSWSENHCKRDIITNSQIKVASKIENDVWTVELSIPHQISQISPNKIFLLAQQFKFSNYRLTLVDSPIWLDHFQSFAKLKPAQFNLKSSLSNLNTGTLNLNHSLKAKNNAPQSSYNILSALSIPEISSTYDILQSSYDTIGGIEVQIKDKKILHQNQKNIALASNQKNIFNDFFKLPNDGLFRLSGLITSEKNIFYRRNINFTAQSPVELTLLPLPSTDSVKAKISTFGYEGSLNNTKLKIDFIKNNKSVMTKLIDLTKRNQKAVFSCKKLRPDEYTLNLALIKDHKEIYSAQQNFTKRKIPKWLKNKTGIEALSPDWTPSPWTPVKVSNNTIKVWGREHHLAAGSLIDNLKSQNKDLLKSAAKLKYKVNQKTKTVKLGAPQFQLKAKGRVIAEQKAENNDFTALVKHFIEFDGFHRIQVSLTPKKSLNLNQVWLEFPFQNITIISDGRGMLKGGKATSRKIFTNNSPWVGNSEAGCGFVFENFINCKLDARKPRITIDCKDKNADVKIFIVNTSTTISEPIALEFALQAAPYKPYPENWRDWRCDGWTISQEKSINITMLDPRHWSNSYMRILPRSWSLLKYYTDLHKHLNRRLYLYACPRWFSPYDMLPKEQQADWNFSKTPNIYWDWLRKVQKKEITRKYYTKKANAPKHPDYWYFKEEWRVKPEIAMPGDRKETSEHVLMSTSSSWTDYFVHGVKELLTQSEVDGLYFDLATVNLTRCNYDPERNFSYTTLDGTKEGTAEIFSTRDLYKRLYYLFEKYRGPDKKPYILGHGRPAFIGIAPFWDLVFGGESVRSINFHYGLTQTLTSDSKQKGYAGPYDYSGKTWRSQFGKQFGIPSMFLPQYVFHKNLKTEESCREILSWTLPHNTILWPYHAPNRTMFNVWGKVEIPFDIGSAEFSGYWETNYQAQPSIKLSYWRRPVRNSVLVVIANWSNKDIVTDLVPPNDLKDYKKAFDVLDTKKEYNLLKYWRFKIKRNNFRLLLLNK